MLSGSDSKRFWSKVAQVGNVCECWPWMAGKNVEGYGRFALGNKKQAAHRIAFADTFGSVTDGLVLDHLCSTKECCNPWHLEEVSRRENTIRGQSPVAKNARMESCSKGHSFVGVDWPSGRKRYCQVCNRISSKARYYANKQRSC